jgi:hypothetical protein
MGMRFNLTAAYTIRTVNGFPKKSKPLSDRIIFTSNVCGIKSRITAAPNFAVNLNILKKSSIISKATAIHTYIICASPC